MPRSKPAASGRKSFSKREFAAVLQKTDQRLFNNSEISNRIFSVLGFNGDENLKKAALSEIKKQFESAAFIDELLQSRPRATALHRSIKKFSTDAKNHLIKIKSRRNLEQKTAAILKARILAAKIDQFGGPFVESIVEIARSLSTDPPKFQNYGLRHLLITDPETTLKAIVDRCRDELPRLAKQDSRGRNLSALPNLIKNLIQIGRELRPDSDRIFLIEFTISSFEWAGHAYGFNVPSFETVTRYLRPLQ